MTRAKLIGTRQRLADHERRTDTAALQICDKARARIEELEAELAELTDKRDPPPNLKAPRRIDPGA